MPKPFDRTKGKNFIVAGMGDLVADLMIAVEEFPINVGSAQFVDKVELQPGGMGNFLIAGQRIGLSMISMDILGDDQNGSFIIESLKKEGIKTTFVEKIPGVNTKEIIVLADNKGKHAFMAYRDKRYPKQDHNPFWQYALEELDALLTVGYSLSEEYIADTLLEAMKYVHEKGKKVFFDPGPMIDLEKNDRFKTAVASSDVVLLTDDELEIATGGRSPEFCRKIFDFGVETICVKQGPQGCYIANHNQVVQCPGYKVQVADTNGAGDSFAAAFIYGFLHGWSLEDIGAFSNIMGAVKVQKFGAGRNVPTRQELITMAGQYHFLLPGDFLMR
jgi:2-dehydro-3-deoxygluconokinase